MSELRRNDIKRCSLCGRGVMHSNYIFFYRVKVEQFVIDVSAVARAHGADMMMGPLAAVMTPDEPLAKGLGEHELIVCADHLHDVHWKLRPRR